MRRQPKRPQWRHGKQQTGGCHERIRGDLHVNKPNRTSAYEYITHIGNVAGNWRITRESAIQRIDGKQEALYTVDKTTGRKVYIGVVREAGKAPYLRTHADGKWNDNLLALAECGSNCALISYFSSQK
ncbi:MAG: DUF3892 domain-containing protein [Bryobacteraceae bacterium]|nr:DUF3892 domain-containing protein [Bryobacteraceae bacterium]